MKKLKKSKPTSEMLDSFKEISKYGTEYFLLKLFYIVSNNSQSGGNNTNNIYNKQPKVKMPFKMYMGIKKSVIKKHEKEKEHRQKVNFFN